MKLDKLLQMRKVLSDHANEPIPTMLAYKILKFMKASDTESAFYDQKLKKIIERYGQRDSEGRIESSNGRITIASDCIEDCKKAMEELGETEVEIPNIAFSIQELTPIKFSVSELFALNEIIVEEG